MATRILFQGDSVTDAGRRKSPTGLAGYTEIAAALIRQRYPDAELEFVNRGISGNRSKDLLSRYEEDFVAVDADVITVMIGINDVWRLFDSFSYTSPRRYRENLTKLISDLRRDTHAKIIILSPYLLPHKKHLRMRRLATRFIQTCEETAAAADAYVNTDIPMNAALKEYSLRDIAEDGVHPSKQGQRILAELTANAVCEFLPIK